MAFQTFNLSEAERADYDPAGNQYDRAALDLLSGLTSIGTSVEEVGALSEACREAAETVSVKRFKIARAHEIPVEAIITIKDGVCYHV